MHLKLCSVTLWKQTIFTFHVNFLLIPLYLYSDFYWSIFYIVILLLLLKSGIWIFFFLSLIMYCQNKIFHCTDLSFRPQQQLNLSFLRGSRDQSKATSLLWWDTANSPHLLFEKESLSPALMMSPLLSGRPSRYWQDKASVPGGLFPAAPACFTDSLPTMMDTQRTTSHRATQ